MFIGERRKWVLLAVLLLALDALAVGLSVAESSASSEVRPFTVSDVLNKALLGDYVYVSGTVSEVREDHVSEKGYVYQEFTLSDEEGESIKLFCSVKYGRSNVSEGNEITFNGELRKYFREMEIYGFCSEIEVL